MKRKRKGERERERDEKESLRKVCVHSWMYLVSGTWNWLGSEVMHVLVWVVLCLPGCLLSVFNSSAGGSRRDKAPYFLPLVSRWILMPDVYWGGKREEGKKGRTGGEMEREMRRRRAPVHLCLLPLIRVYFSPWPSLLFAFPSTLLHYICVSVTVWVFERWHLWHELLPSWGEDEEGWPKWRDTVASVARCRLCPLMKMNPFGERQWLVYLPRAQEREKRGKREGEKEAQARARSVIGIFCFGRRHLQSSEKEREREREREREAKWVSESESERGKKVICLLLAAPAVMLLIHVFIDVLEMPRHNNNVTITRAKTMLDLTYIDSRTCTVSPSPSQVTSECICAPTRSHRSWWPWSARDFACVMSHVWITVLCNCFQLCYPHPFSWLNGRRGHLIPSPNPVNHFPPPIDRRPLVSGESCKLQVSQVYLELVNYSTSRLGSQSDEVHRMRYTGWGTQDEVRKGGSGKKTSLRMALLPQACLAHLSPLTV